MTRALDTTPLAQLSELKLGRSRTALWWLGQSSFALRGSGTTILVDPYLAPHDDRLVPPPFAPPDATGVDVIACTHDHLDHLDDESLPGLARASPQATIVVPEPVLGRVSALGISAERIVGAQPGQPIELSAVTIHPVPACHGVHPEDAYTFGRELSGGLCRYLGYVFELDGTRVYHAGDTILYEGMEALVGGLVPDVALLPINGRDPEREARDIVGNLDESEAARLAAALGVDLLVPMHYDMFAANPGSPGKLVELVLRDYPGPAVAVLSRERPFVYTKAPEG
jgi:L-ascorbate metabolism protein UlaG (beta-lactamase superfamily)